MMSNQEFNAILIILIVFIIFLRNWLIENANNYVKGKEFIGFFEAYTNNIFNLKMFNIKPILSKTNHSKADLFLFYSNILAFIIYSLVLIVFAELVI